MSQYLGDISAYALAVSQGYTGTEEEYAELMASYATVGQTAVTAAQTATTKASEAATSATTATTKASEAASSATTATTAAEAAQADADAAALDASQALSAASTATSKATEATTAAATAVSAKDDAVSANTAAQSAKTAAQTAQAGAETAAASVQASAAQIAQNTSDISELKEDLNDTNADVFKAFPTDTASGAVASFADGANVPVKSLIVNIDPVQSGSGDPSPSNVRPISGLSEVNVVVSEKNLFNENAYVEMGIDSQGGGTYYVAGRNMLFAPVESGETYTISVGDLGTSSYFYFGTYATAPLASGIPAKSFGQVEGTVKTITIPSTANYVACFFGTGKPVNAQLEKGAVATDYQPFDVSLTVDLGQTVYGGKLDVLSGVLTVDKKIIDGGTVQWNRFADGKFYSDTITDAKAGLLAYGYDLVICSIYRTVSIASLASMPNCSISMDNGKHIQIRDDRFTDEPSFETAMSGVQCVYDLATPLTIQLTAHEVATLLGSNNVWADTGDTEVTYRADPTLYINRLTEPDADMVADSNITSGSYFMVGNTLYKATSNIASGATISPNVNCTRKSLSEALNELNA